MAARFSAKFQVVINEDACFLFLFFLSLKFFGAEKNSAAGTLNRECLCMMGAAAETHSLAKKNKC